MNTQRMGLAAVIALGALTIPAANAVTGCSTAMLAGNYAMQFSGAPAPTVVKSLGGVSVPASIAQAVSSSVVNGGKATVPAAGILRLYLDGSGVVTGNSSVNLKGAWLQGTIVGQYSVDQDCSASFTLSDVSGATGNFAGVVVGQGDTVLMVQTDDGAGVSGLARKTRGFCQTSDLAGAFGIQYSGSSADDGTPYSSVGIINLDGQGGAGAIESRFSSGSYAQKSSNGQIAINDDCSATLTLTTLDDAAKSISFTGIVTADNRVLLVQSDSGMAATGTMVAQ